MNRTWSAILILLGILLSVSPALPTPERLQNGDQRKTYEFRNGKWFDGRTFREKIFYSVAGKLTTKRPSRIDETIDLNGGFVVPPFGDAHCHHFDSSYNIDQQIGMYLRDGVFY